MSLDAGQTLAHYEILEPIGQGGMGEVYRARDGKLDRDVAIKVLPEAFADDVERLARFEREAKVLASLNHPAIAAIYGVEAAAGVHYLVLELVPGETLAERIARGPVPAEEAIELTVKIAEALEEAHERGIVHRDLKPANIKSTPDGKVKVLDFGLAKGFEDDAPPPDDSLSPTMTRGATRAGTILGTAAYMSPEQARGKPVDARTDIWALGCCLFELLTGSKAFGGESVTDILASIVTKEPSWDALPSETSPAVRRVLRRCLQKDRKLRFHHVADARLALQESEPAPTEEVARPARRRTSLAALASTAALASLLTGATFFLMGREPRSAPAGVVRAALPIEDEHLAVSLNTALAFSPDGRTVAYLAQEGANTSFLALGQNTATQLRIRSLDTARARTIEDSQGAAAPVFSPDSQWVAFLANGKLRKAPLSGGPAIRIAELKARDYRGIDWGDDGYIYFADSASSGLSRVSSAGGPIETLTTPDPSAREKSHRTPHVLPGAETVLFTLGTGDIRSWDEGSVAALSLATGKYEVLIPGGMSPRYSSSGHIVYARADSLVAVPFDAEQVRILGAPVTVLDEVEMSPFGANAEFALSRDGDLVYAPWAAADVPEHVRLVNRRGEAEEMFRARATATRYSPDGRRLASFIISGNDTIGIYDFERDILAEVARGFDNRFPAWSPTGDRLVFSSNRAGAFNLFVHSIDGSAPPERLTESPNEQYPGSWSPDGRWIAYQQSSPDTGWDIWALSLNDGESRLLVGTEADERYPQFSPDGKWVAYASDETGNVEIYVQSFPDSGRVRRVSSGGGQVPRWTADGRELLYFSHDHLMSVRVDPGAASFLGRPEALFELGAVGGGDQTSWASFDVSPDGRHFVVDAVTRPREGPTHLNLVLNWGEELDDLAPRDR